MSVWAKEEEVSYSQVDEKQQTFYKQILAGRPSNNGTQKGI